MDAYDSIRTLLENTTERAVRYVEDLPSRSVAPTEEAISALKGLHTPLLHGPCMLLGRRARAPRFLSKF